MGESVITVGEFGNKRTPKQAIVDMVEEAGAETAHLAVAVVIHSDGMISTSWSDGKLHEIIGILESAKLRIRDIQSLEDD